MDNHEFLVFRGETISYDIRQNDRITFSMDIGDNGELIDEDGDSYFIHIEHHTDTGEFFFQFWYEDAWLNPSYNQLTYEERENLKQFMLRNLHV